MKTIYPLFLFFFFTLQAMEPNLTVKIPMRDGTELSADLYFPDDTPSKHPCVLVRSPAGRKNSYALVHLPLVKEGFVVAIQDTRSALDVEGKTFPFWYDGWGEEQDGYDTVEWLAQCPYTNGNIGTVGVSALGITQYMMAPSAPPSLKCQHIGTAASSIYHHALTHGGQIQKEIVEAWLSLYAWDTGVHSYATNTLFYNDFWERFDSISVVHQTRAPAFHYGGWYDIFLKGTIEAFSAMQERGGKGAKGKQRLLIGPWTHMWPQDPRYGDFEMPETGYSPPVDLSQIAWLNYHLKGVDNGIADLPPVTYYVMGPLDGTPSSGHIWRHADTWPPPSTELSYYLTPNGQLTQTKTTASAQIHYTYDPHNPAPTTGGRNLFLESGPKDQRAIEMREDVIVFTSSPLAKELEVTGEIKALLYFSSDRDDTDLVVRLTDVYPDGKSILITEGVCRIGLHKPSDHYEVDMSSTSVVFAKGHRLRISVGSSNYPRYEKNLNVGITGSHSGKYAIAHNTIHVGKDAPSKLILPVVK